MTASGGLWQWIVGQRRTRTILAVNNGPNADFEAIECTYLDKPFIQSIYRLERLRIRERQRIWAKTNHIAELFMKSTMGDFWPSTIDIHEAPPVC
jgi:hypothetical protein